MKIILGKKIGMTQIVNEQGIFEPATIIEAGPCYVSQIKNLSDDKYNAVQIAFGEKKNLSKTPKGHLKKAGIKNNLKFLKEFRIEELDLSAKAQGAKAEKYKLGQEIKADIFKEGEKVDVIGTSKGKGFQGVIKRHGFSRGPETHGSHHHRRPGSIGSMFPEHVIKGKKMPGHMGVNRITAKNLKILKVDPEKNMIAITGAVPGPNKGLIIIRGK